MTLPPTSKLAGGVGVLSLLVALGLVYVGVPDGRATRSVATPTPSASSTDIESTERESIPASCREVLAGPPPSLPDHEPMVFTSATVLTMDPEGNRAGSVSIKDGRIVSTSKEASLAIDLEGATVMPGFIDSHTHWIGDKDVVGLTAQQSIDKALSWSWTSISELFVSFERLGELCDLESNGDFE